MAENPRGIDESSAPPDSKEQRERLLNVVSYVWSMLKCILHSMQDRIYVRMWMMEMIGWAYRMFREVALSSRPKSWLNLLIYCRRRTSNVLEQAAN